MLSEPPSALLARPRAEPWVSDRGHTDEQLWCSVSLEQAGIAQELVSYLVCDFFYLFTFLEPNPFICDLTCNDEIKLRWLFHKCTYQSCTSSPPPMRQTGWSLSIQYACLHLHCPLFHTLCPTDTQTNTNTQINKYTHFHTHTYTHKHPFTHTLGQLCCSVYRLFTVIAWAFSPKCVFFLFQSYNSACWAGE